MYFLSPPRAFFFIKPKLIHQLASGGGLPTTTGGSLPSLLETSLASSREGRPGPVKPGWMCLDGRVHDHGFSSSLGCQRGCRNTSPQNRDPSSSPSGINKVRLRTFHPHLSISYSRLLLAKPAPTSLPDFMFCFHFTIWGLPRKPNWFPQPHPTGLMDK